jgi:hypothetical protein
MTTIIAAFKREMRFAIKDEHAAPYHIGPYLVMFLAAVVALLVAIFSSLPPDLPAPRGKYYSGDYNSVSLWFWMGLSLLCPLLVFVSYWLPTRVHDSRYFSILLRFGGDGGQLFVLASLEVSTIKLASDSIVYRHVLFYGFILFCAVMLIRDIALIVATERLAHRMEQDRPVEGDT